MDLAVVVIMNLDVMENVNQDINVMEIWELNVNVYPKLKQNKKDEKRQCS